MSDSEDDDQKELELNVEEDGDEDGDEVSIAALFQTFFASSEGENVVDVLSQLKKTLETQNKILMKIMNKVSQA